MNKVPQVAAICYSLSFNLLLIWAIYYSTTKKKLKHYSLYFNDLTIGFGILSAFVSALLFGLIMIALSDQQSFGVHILFFAFLSYLLHYFIMKKYGWNKAFEQKLIDFRMTIEAEKIEKGEILKEFLRGSNLKEVTDYLDKINVYDSNVDAIIENLRKLS